MSGRIRDRVAFVTGASGGLGRSICLRLASEGAKIVCVDLYEAPRNKTNPTTGKADDFNNRIDNAETTLTELHKLYGEDRSIFVKADITRASDVEAAIAACVEKFGRLDILACNAGISVEASHAQPHGIHELSESDWDKTMAINTKGVFLCCKYGIAQMLKQDLLPGVKDRGWVVNTSSIQGLAAYYNTRESIPVFHMTVFIYLTRCAAAYTASKHAVTGLTKQVALDYAPHRIHVNAICPGFLRTTMTQNLQNDPAAQARIDARHPYGGMGDPDDVAKAVLYLASDDCAWMTGVNLPVDGGYMIM
jgi:NAD(P)-dependent dehydrogenase (short-subunit alcohol dehydrogenase family)